MWLKKKKSVHTDFVIKVVTEMSAAPFAGEDKLEFLHLGEAAGGCRIRGDYSAELMWIPYSPEQVDIHHPSHSDHWFGHSRLSHPHLRV